MPNSVDRNNITSHNSSALLVRALLFSFPLKHRKNLSILHKHLGTLAAGFERPLLNDDLPHNHWIVQFISRQTFISVTITQSMNQTLSNFESA